MDNRGFYYSGRDQEVKNLLSITSFHKGKGTIGKAKRDIDISKSKKFCNIIYSKSSSCIAMEKGTKWTKCLNGENSLI